jgi:hypothetical protein
VIHRPIIYAKTNKSYFVKSKSEMNMKQVEKLNLVLEEAGKLQKSIKGLILEIDDYDLKRLLKKIDAELMDVQHNLVLATRLTEGMARKRKKSRK